MLRKMSSALDNGERENVSWVTQTLNNLNELLKDAQNGGVL